MTSQSLEWLTLLAEAAARDRAMNMLDQTYAARAAQVESLDFKNFASAIKKQIT